MMRKKSDTARGLPDIGVGLLSPAEMFAQALPGALIIDTHLPFAERVERAWRNIRVTRYTPEEHEQLREVLIITIQPEVPKRETK
jgi:hypothetical protein